MRKLIPMLLFIVALSVQVLYYVYSKYLHDTADPYIAWKEILFLGGIWFFWYLVERLYHTQFQLTEFDEMKLVVVHVLTKQSRMLPRTSIVSMMPALNPQLRSKDGFIPVVVSTKDDEVLTVHIPIDVFQVFQEKCTNAHFPLGKGMDDPHEVIGDAFRATSWTQILKMVLVQLLLLGALLVLIIVGVSWWFNR